MTSFNYQSSDHPFFAGRLVSWKHVDHVLHALPQVGDLCLDVAGVGPELESLRRLTSALGLDDRVAFLGDLGSDEVLERMRRAPFLVLPSSYEGMPHVV